MESVEQIVAAVASGHVTASAVLAEHVARHEASHRRLNALIQPQHAESMHHAGRLEAAPPGPLGGVPISIKECFPVRGLLTTLGIPARRQARDAADAAIVARLRSAGALVVGKANVPQAMYLHETDNPVWGRTNHPLDPERNAGGSSGGDAALVAAGVVPLAVGTDLAGSIRQPAHACGIAGIVPRTATLGDGGAFDTLPHLTVVRPRAGLLAAHVDDLRLGLAALAAIDTSAGDRPPTRLRIGWWDGSGPLEPSPAVRRAVHEAVAHLAAAGATVTQLPATLAEEAAWLHLAILSADGGADIRALYAGSSPIPEVARLLRLAGLPRWVRPLLATTARLIGRRIEARGVAGTGPRTAAAFAELVAGRAALAARLEALAADHDAFVCPVSALPAMRHGTAARLLVAAAPCLLANLLDLPAGAVSVTTVRGDEECGRPPSRDPVAMLAAETDRGSRGLPVGVQVIGLRTAPGVGERLVLDVMRIIEQAARGG